MSADGSSCDDPFEAELALVDNRPGLTAVAYRIGTHARFVKQLHQGLADSKRPVLRGLTTRDNDDFSIALLDAWSTAADVVTFYQERIANESYLRTATERQSVRELARLIGYQLGPGVAAGAALAFTLDAAPGAPGALTLDPGVKVQSIPGPGESPQLFETVEPLPMKPSWNAMKPVMLGPVSRKFQLVCRGVGIGLQVGDPLAINDLTETQSIQIVRVEEVEERPADPGAFFPTTLVRWTGLGMHMPDDRVINVRRLIHVAAVADSQGNADFSPGTITLADPPPALLPASAETAFLVEGPPGSTSPDDYLAAPFQAAGSSKNSSNQTIVTLTPLNGFPLKPFQPPNATLYWLPFSSDPNVAPPPLDVQSFSIDERIYLAGVQTGLATGDALLLISRSNPRRFRLVIAGSVQTFQDRSLTIVTPSWTGPRVQLPLPDDFRVLALRQRAALFGHNAPDPRLVTTKDTGIFETNASHPEDGWKNFHTVNDSIDLDAVYPKVVAGSPLVLVDRDPAGMGHVVGLFVASIVATATRAAFGLSAKITRVTPQRDPDVSASLFNLRRTLVYAAPEELQTAPAPIDDEIAGSAIVLAGDVSDLPRGRALIVSGKRTDTGEAASELVTVTSVAAAGGGSTAITVSPPLAGSYRRSSVAVLGNVVRATHGETVTEILGSGDATRAFQRFTLRQSPLTFVSAPTATGRSSTLQIRAGGLLWREVPALHECGPADRVYVLQAQDDGTTAVQFGDGTHGARLPTGESNVRAVYRKGLGLAGQVGAGKLSLLQSRPLGVKAVDNPLPASGAADPEVIEDARHNAPLPVLTLGRVVSLQDYQDFASAFTGVAKAFASPVRDGLDRAVLLTVAGPRGAVIQPSDALGKNLLSALRALGDPHTPVRLQAYRPALFRIAGKVRIDADRLPSDMSAAVRAALLDRFGFDARDIAQPVALSEVIAAIQLVPGVALVDLERFFRSDSPDPPGVPPRPRLLAQSPSARALGEILLIDPQTFDDVQVLP
jgi:predicted phage baseplate assembly protein